MPMFLPNSNIEVPSPNDKSACFGYTGFNSVNPHEIYACERLPARRAQIVRGYGKPVIQQLRDGTLIASQFRDCRGQPNPSYPDVGEEVALCYSSDGGETWAAPVLVGIPGRATTLTVLRSGNLILTTQGGHKRSTPYRSTDQGRTWTPCGLDWQSLALKDQNVLFGFGETNGVAELPDGTLLLCAYSVAPKIQRVTDYQTYLLRSQDDGRTWSDVTPLLAGTDEVELLVRSDGRLLGYARLDTIYTREVWHQQGQLGEGGDQMAVMESHDQGRTWSDPKPIGLGAGQVPAFPIALDDTRVLLIYGNRQFPFGAQAIGSTDGGLTFNLQRVLILASASWDNYCGHPRSIRLATGEILTGYYARYFREGTVAQDIVSHCLRWAVPSGWPE